MSDQPEFVAYAVARDERLRAVMGAIEIEEARRDGAAFRIVMDVLEQNARIAADQLANCNPADMGSIAAFQAEVRLARTIRDHLERLLHRGQEAELSLREDADMYHHEMRNDV